MKKSFVFTYFNLKWDIITGIYLGVCFTMKKLFLFILIAWLFASPCVAGEKLNVVATIFPVYDWAREILKDKAELTLLLDKGVDLHSYQPTVEDMIKISNCDVFIYVGGESDEWVNDALKNSANNSQRAVNLLEILGSLVKPEEIVEGMEHEHEHKHEAEADEHVWLSLKNACAVCKYISELISDIDPENRGLYRANAENYIKELSELDAEYKKVIDASERRVFLFGDRFPFRYLADDYGLKYYAAFSGCSAETEASFETVIFLAKKVDELKLPCVLTIENPRHKIAETIIASTAEKNQSVLSLNSMQSTTMKDIREGATYLSIMQKNLDTLKTALN